MGLTIVGTLLYDGFKGVKDEIPLLRQMVEWRGIGWLLQRWLRSWEWAERNLGHMILFAERLSSLMGDLGCVKLVLFFTRDIPVETWDDVGLFDHEVVLCRAFRPHLDGITFVTYGDASARLAGVNQSRT